MDAVVEKAGENVAVLPPKKIFFRASGEPLCLLMSEKFRHAVSPKFFGADFPDKFPENFESEVELIHFSRNTISLEAVRNLGKEGLVSLSPRLMAGFCMENSALVGEMFVVSLHSHLYGGSELGTVFCDSSSVVREYYGSTAGKYFGVDKFEKEFPRDFAVPCIRLADKVTPSV